MNENRLEKYKNVIAKRQAITVILENVHDPHNIGAVIRSCDAVGIPEIYLLYTPESQNYIKQKVGKNSSSGARKWIKMHYFDNIPACFEAVRKKYTKIYGTHLDTQSYSLYDLDLTPSVALMFGNEHVGISSEALKQLDGNFIIPQYGMVQSLNISVACAVSLFEASRQRNNVGSYNHSFDESNQKHSAMFDWFIENHLEYGRKNQD